MFKIDVITKERAEGELKIAFKTIERIMGFVPPHFELFGTLDLEGLKKFTKESILLQRDEKIDARILPILRLIIAKKECRRYCIEFNTKLLEKDFGKDFVKEPLDTLSKLSLAEEQKILVRKIAKAIYDSENFTKEDIEELYNLGFDDKEFFKILSYCVRFMANSKMIDIYLS